MFTCTYIYRVRFSLRLTKYYSMKTYWWSGGIVPRILDLVASWRWSPGNFTMGTEPPDIHINIQNPFVQCYLFLPCFTVRVTLQLTVSQWVSQSVRPSWHWALWDCFRLWSAAANELNMQSRIADKGCTSSSVVERQAIKYITVKI
jgi:hypothetical protein